MKLLLSNQLIVINLLPLSYFSHFQCHHFSDHGHEHSDGGHDHSDQSLNHQNNDDDQHKYDVGYVKFT